MPIRSNALPSPEPDPTPDAIASDGTELDQSGGTQEPPKRSRRSKAQMIADAVIPTDGEQVEIKDLNTGAVVTRPWLDAVELFRKGAVEFVEKSNERPSPLKYAVAKMDQQAAAPAFATEPVATESIEQPQPSLSEQVGSAPPEAALGDEVRIGSETYRVGHGGVLTSSVVAENGKSVVAKRRWQRELGAGPNGPWESVVLTQTSDQRPIFDGATAPKVDNTGAFGQPNESPAPDATPDHDQAQADIDSLYGDPAPQNGNGGEPQITVETQKLPRTYEEIEPGVIKIGTGMLDKIGIPAPPNSYGGASALQIGPITMSRQIVDDGRRHVEIVRGREVTVISAAAEAFEELDNTVEFVGARFRGQLQSFLEAIGATQQPVS